MSTASGSESGAVTKATQTEDDWGEIKADIKKLVEAVQSLVPQPKDPEIERQFGCDARWLGREIRPTPEKLEFHVDVLLSMFIRNKDGEPVLFKNSLILECFLADAPAFLRNLILRIPGEKDIHVGTMPSDLVNRLRDYALGQRVEVYSFPDQELVDETTATWEWNNHTFRVYTGIRHARFGPWYSMFTRRNRSEEWNDEIVSNHGYGTLCLIRVPVEKGILEFRTINFILAQIGRWDTRALTRGGSREHYHYYTSAMYFLGVFAGQWPSRNERIRFSRRSGTSPNQEGFYYLQLHFRCFESITSRNKSSGTGGLKCDREQGQIGSDTFKLAAGYIEERRISIFGVLYKAFTHDPPFYSVLVLADFEFDPDTSWDSERCAGLEGVITFYAAIFASISLWQTKWNDVLAKVDEHLRVRLEHTLDPGEINMWMFDDNFKRSKLYVTILQILRIFEDYIRTVSDDLRSLDRVFLKDYNFPMRNMRPDELRIMRTNWESVKEFQKQAEESLLGRISQKTEEVKSLRDGLFNSSSLLEANLSSREARRSAVMGRYILIFTVVTILYLPPGFISTVLDMDIFQNKDDIAQTKWEYKVTVVTVSLLTYLLAFASIIAVDWDGSKRRFSSWLAPVSCAWSIFQRALVIGLFVLMPECRKLGKDTCLQWWDFAKNKYLRWWALAPDGSAAQGEGTGREEGIELEVMATASGNAASENIAASGGGAAPPGTAASEDNPVGSSSGSSAGAQAGRTPVQPPELNEAGPGAREKDLEKGPD